MLSSLLSFVLALAPSSTPSPSPEPQPVPAGLPPVPEGLQPVGGVQRQRGWIPNSWPVQQRCDFLTIHRQTCLTLRGEVFTGFRYAAVAEQDLSEFRLDRGEVGTGVVWKPNARIDAGLVVGIEAVRSAGPHSLIGIDGDSLVVRMLETYGQLAIHAAPIDIGIRAGLIPETLTLANPTDDTVDSVAFEGADAAISWCRIPDGEGPWDFCAQTFGALNAGGQPQPDPVCGNETRESGEDCDGSDLDGEACEDVGDFDGGSLACTDDCTFDTAGCESPSSSVTVVLNEFSSTAPDEIELFNASDDDVDLSGWILTDDLTDPRDRYDAAADREELLFANGTILEAGGFLVLERGDLPDHPFGLGSGGDTIALMDAELTVVDFVEYGDGEVAVRLHPQLRRPQ